MQYSYRTLLIMYNSILNILLTCFFLYLRRTSTLDCKTSHINPPIRSSLDNLWCDRVNSIVPYHPLSIYLYICVVLVCVGECAH